MVQNKSITTVELVPSRLFQGGRTYPLWQMFRLGRLTGQFLFQGQLWSASIDLSEGKVMALVFQDRDQNAFGINGFEGFKRALAGDGAARFSILVPERMEQV